MLPLIDRRFWPWLLAIAVPTLLAFSQSPSPVFYNGAASWFGIGVLLAWTAWKTRHATGAGLVLAGLLAMLVAPWVWPGASALAPLLAVITIAAGRLLAGAHGATVLKPLSLAWLLAGLAGTAIGIAQYIAPGALPAWLVSEASTAGRAVSNLRQPNQLTTALFLAVCGLAFLATTRRWPFHRTLAVHALLLLGVALTGSRMSWLMAVLISIAAAIDRRALPDVRRVLLLTIPLLAGWTLAAWAWGHFGGVTYFGEARLASNSDISSSRFAIWSNTLDLILAHPWAGVGWGHFNFAWTLTPFPNRPVAFFDHTHNLVLQLAVELGIPATVAIFGGFGWLAWRARPGLSSEDDDHALASRTALMMVAIVLLHSMLEYPLWYPYFLFPTALAFGIYLGLGRAAKPPAPWATRHLPALFAATGVTMIAGSLYAVWDYQRVVQIFAPYGDAVRTPLSLRIAEGQGSTFFAHHADYAAVTTAERPSDAFDAFERPLHRLIDARLMIAYAKALDERGERDKAVYVAQRLREFRHPLGEQFFKACNPGAADPETLPFQCDTRPVIGLGFEDFRQVDRQPVHSR